MALAKGTSNLTRSRQRVSDHGEVFTPAWMVDEMLNLVGVEAGRIDSRFLEPACGSGNFLVQVLRRKLRTVDLRHGQSGFEKRHYALLGLMCIYGIELLQDNVEECRAMLLEEFLKYCKPSSTDLLKDAAALVLSTNIVRGDALTMTTRPEGTPITFPEWGYLGKGRYQRRDFRYDSLTQRSSFEGTLWDHLEEHEIFTPTKVYRPMTIKDLAE